MKNKGKGKSKNSGKAHKQPESKNNDPFKNIIITDMSIWGEKNEEVLEKKLRGKVENLFMGVFNDLVSTGYKNEVASNAVVLNGHVFHGADLFNKSVKNSSIAFINEGGIDQGCHISEHIPKTLEERISDLQELLIFLAQRGHPSWTKSDAMKFLIVNDLQVNPPKSTDFSSSQEKISRTPGILDQFAQDPRVKHTIIQLREDHNGSGSSVLGEYGSSSDTCNSDTNASTIDSSQNVDLLKKINLTLELESRLEENVSKLVAAFKREMVESSTNSTCLLDSIQINESKRTLDCMDEEDESYLSLVEAGLKYGPDHTKNYSIMSSVNYTRELKEQLKERKEWANKKFVQAAQRLSDTLVELKFLRLERSVREKTTFQDKGGLQDKFFDKKICEKDGILKKVSTQLGRVNQQMRRLERMNSAYMANSEASKLSYTEYRVKGLEFVKMEKKRSKRAMDLEKLCLELEEQVVEAKGKETDSREEAIQVKKAIQEDEENLREALKQKELTAARVSEENKLNKAVEADIKRNQAMLSQKLEIDFQLMKDEKLRLEEELSNYIKRSGDSSRLLFEGTSRTHAFDVDIFTDAMPLDSLILQDSSTDEGFESRKCIACSKSEALVLFLPCAHQVTCVDCNNRSDFAGICPYCKVPIEDRISIYGSST